MARAQKKYDVSFPRDCHAEQVGSQWQSFLVAPKTKAYSERTYKRNVLIRSERSQGERRDKRRAYVTHKPVLQTITTSCSHLPFGLCAPFSHTPKTALSSFLLSHKFACFWRAGALVCEVQVSKCVLFFALANEWHNKGTIPIYSSADCLPRERRITL